MDARVFCIPRREGFVIILPTYLYWQQKGPNFKDGAGFIYGALFPILDSRKGFFGTNPCFGPKFWNLVWRHQMKMYPKKHKTASSSNLPVASKCLAQCFPLFQSVVVVAIWPNMETLHCAQNTQKICPICVMHRVQSASCVGCIICWMHVMYLLILAHQNTCCNCLFVKL